LRRHLFRRQGPLDGARATRPLGDPVDATKQSNDADALFWMAEAGCFSGKNDIGPQREFQTAGAEALNGSNRRNG
jgi:hypothetical protein